MTYSAYKYIMACHYSTLILKFAFSHWTLYLLPILVDSHLVQCFYCGFFASYMSRVMRGCHPRKFGGLQEGLEKAIAPHSSTLAWKIPWTEEPGRLQSMGSLRVGHGWQTSLSPFTFMHWSRKWQPTLVVLPGESQGRGSLVDCCLWCRTESDTTEAT